MRAFYAILFAFISFVGNVSGQITNGFPMGDQVEKYSLAQVTRMEVFLKQKIGTRTLIHEIDNATFTNRTGLETFFQAMLRKAAGRLLTEQVGQDKTAPFSIVASASQLYWDEFDEIMGFPYFQVTDVKFSLLKTGSNYTLPDFSGVKMDFPRQIGYAVNHLKWIGLTASNGEDTIFDTDSTIPSQDPTVEEVDLHRGISYVFISKDLVLNNDVDIRIRTLTSDSSGELQFQVFDKGIEVATNPISLSINRYPPKPPSGSGIVPLTTIQIAGGERGMNVKIQSSTNLTDWVDASETRFTILPYETSTYTEPADHNQSFYRVKLVE